eukprot:2368736-Rhodomonas_salina.1
MRSGSCGKVMRERTCTWSHEGGREMKRQGGAGQQRGRSRAAERGRHGKREKGLVVFVPSSASDAFSRCPVSLFAAPVRFLSPLSRTWACCGSPSRRPGASTTITDCTGTDCSLFTCCARYAATSQQAVLPQYAHPLFTHRPRHPPVTAHSLPRLPTDCSLLTHLYHANVMCSAQYHTTAQYHDASTCIRILVARHAPHVTCGITWAGHGVEALVRHPPACHGQGQRVLARQADRQRQRQTDRPRSRERERHTHRHRPDCQFCRPSPVLTWRVGIYSHTTSVRTAIQWLLCPFRY